MREAISLLHPVGLSSTIKSISEETFNDLSIDYLCECLTNNEQELRAIKKVLKGITSDPDVIAYRTDVFEDFFKNPNLREEMSKSLKDLAFLYESSHGTGNIEKSSIWDLVGKLSELDSYIHCVISIKDCLEKCQISSKGLKDLYHFVTCIYEDSGFTYLQEDIHQLVAEVSMVKSVSLGINLDERLFPKEVGIVSFNQVPFMDATIMQKIIYFSKVKPDDNPADAFRGMTYVKHHKRDRYDAVMNNLTQLTENMLKANVRELKTVLKKYSDVSAFALIKLIPEVMFYIKCADMVEKLQENGFPMVRAQLVAGDERRFDLKNLYSIKLALQMIKTHVPKSSMVMNDISFKPENRIFVLTGPNRGGKTTFTQALGLVSILFQHGIYVPCSEAALSPVDNIYTHFPVDENQIIELGRLGEESNRLSQIFAQATRHSLLLFNESLATTSYSEGLYIAKDVVRALKYLEARAVFNTHMHDLAAGLDEVNEEVTSDSSVASLVMGIENGERSYKVLIAPSEGLSYARDIARKFGVTFDQLKDSMNK